MQPSGDPARARALAVVLGCVAVTVLLLRLSGSADTAPVGVTWTGTVERLFRKNCVVCHANGGLALPRLDHYESARLAAMAIKQSVLTRHMPRWYAVSGFGEFANDPSLTSYEIELLAQWADGRAPYGDPVPVTARPAARLIEPPDLMLSVAARHRIAEGRATFRLATALGDVRWIRGWTFRPGNPMLITSAVMSVEPGGTLGTWVPGESATFLPEGVAQRLPAGAAIRLTIYYRTPATGPSVDASSVGLYFGDHPRRELEHVSLPCGSTRLPQSIDALAIRPIIGTSAWSLTVSTRERGGSVKPLGWFQHYPANHARSYWFRGAVPLPRGVVIDVGASHGPCGVELDYVRSGKPVVARSTARIAPLDEAESAAPPLSSPGAGIQYWCPMHADVRGARPGACTQCEMALVPVTAEIDGRYRLDVAWLPAAGASGTLRLLVRQPATETTVHRFAIMHERPFHVFLISHDLEEFSHVHPVQQPDGSFELSSVPLRSGAYQMYAEFLPVGGTPQLIRKTVIREPATRGLSDSRPPHLAPDWAEKTDAGMRLRIESATGQLVAGTPSLLAFHLQDAATGEPVADLQPFLGAWGHAFIVSADLADAMHSHPVTPLSSAGGPTIVFRQRFPRAGTYRLWVQVKRRGSIATVSFTVNVIARIGSTTASSPIVRARPSTRSRGVASR